MPSAADPTRRFSGRVADYARHRPGYPAALLQALRETTHLSAATVVADVGSGTGLSSRLFLEEGCLVFAVEPNAEMRRAAESLLGGHPNFRSVAGTAEDTTLEDASVDLVVSAQAFHWFDVEKARAEFARVLRPNGWITIVWNQRRTESTPFLRAYEALLRRWGTDYSEVKNRTADETRLRKLFESGRFERRTFDNEQPLDLPGLRGRLRSSSYVPGEGHPDHAAMLRDLEARYHEFQEGGRVRFEYDTELYLGRVRRGK